MAITYHAGRRIQATSTDFDGIPAISGGWKEVGRTTLGSGNANITVSSLADKRYYMVLGDYRSSSAINANGRLGNGSIDTTTTYRERQQTNGAGYSSLTSQASAPQFGTLSGNTGFGVEYIANKSDKEKLGITNAVKQNTTGAGYAPDRFQSAWKWSNTNNELDAIERRTSVNTYNSGSEVVVLGWDPDDTHTDNFWEELASVDLSGGASTSLSTGTFTAKKYLWVQIFSKKETSGTIQPSLKVGTGGTIATGSPYAFRWSNDGASDPTPSVNLAMCPIAWLGANIHFSNTFIINNSANDKLFINDSVANVTTGEGASPQRVESVGKWANTSGQINIIDLYDWDSRSLGTETIMKVWGSN